MCPLLLARRLRGAISEKVRLHFLLAMYFFFVCFCTSLKKKALPARLKALLQIPCIFNFTSILPFPLFFQNGTRTWTQNNNTKQQLCKNGRDGNWACESLEWSWKSLKAEMLRFADPTGVQHYVSLFQVSGVSTAGKELARQRTLLPCRLLKGWFKILANLTTKTS